VSADAPPIATVVLPAYNVRAIITQQLESLEAQARPRGVEVIVVDDASTDGTAEVVARWIADRGADNFRLVRRERRGGPNAARNEAARLARSEYLLLCDGDDVVCPGWVQALLDARAPRRLVCGDLLEDWWTADGRPLGLGRRLPSPGNAWGQYQYAYSSSLCVARGVVERVGGFDERIMVGGTEIDFAIRALRDGHVEVVHAPDALVRYRRIAAVRPAFRRGVAKELGHCRLFRTYGLTRVSAKQQVRELLLVVRQVPGALRSPIRRAMVAERAGRAVGKLIGGLRYRVLTR
jgi:glycosyltransferase involved in cell wall biosynthesis